MVHQQRPSIIWQLPTTVAVVSDLDTIQCSFLGAPDLVITVFTEARITMGNKINASTLPHKWQDKGTACRPTSCWCPGPCACEQACSRNTQYILPSGAHRLLPPSTHVGIILNHIRNKNKKWTTHMVYVYSFTHTLLCPMKTCYELLALSFVCEFH